MLPNKNLDWSFIWRHIEHEFSTVRTDKKGLHLMGWEGAMTMPSTLAAFTGATGTEVILLVSVTRADDPLPSSEQEAEYYDTTKHINCLNNIYKNLHAASAQKA